MSRRERNNRTFGHTIAVLDIYDGAEADALLRAINRELREKLSDDDREALMNWRRQLMNMKSRSSREEWIGWERAS